MGYYFYDLTGYGLVIIGTIITLVAQFYVNNRYKKYSKIETDSGLTDIYVTETSGVLSDHYDPSRKVVRLSKDVFHGSTIAANSIAAHECGHAIQHKEGYLFIKIRTFIVPLVNFSSKFGYFAIMIGLLFGFIDLAWIGVGLLLTILAFQLITLPTEFNASSRAKDKLEEYGILNSHELDGSNDVLRAAAWTYVAGLANTLLQILRLVLIVANRDDR